MLSVKKLSSATEAGKYYDKADYYTKGEKNVDVNAAWFGQGAAVLGLNGTVDKDQFVKILEGDLPNGQSLARPSGDRVPGWDFTFSAPKSLSLLALVGDDKRLLDAHLDAVKSTLTFAEQEYLVTRMKKHGELKTVGTDKMLAGLFTHTTSRDLDPQLHTHSVITNATEGPDGKWRTIESKPLFSNKMLLGQVYRAELAEKAQQLGYQIEWDRQKGTFEIRGVDKNVIDQFSKRRQAIKDYADKKGLSGGKQLADAALKTRSSKKNSKAQRVIEQWDKDAKAVDFNAKSLIQQAKSLGHSKGHSKTQRDNDAEKIVRFAYRNLSFNEAVFSRQDLISESFSFSRGDHSTQQITQAIDQLVFKKELVSARLDTHQSADQVGYTTPLAIKTEQHNLQLMAFGIGEMANMARPADINHGIEQYNDNNPQRTLQPEQADTVTMALSSKDRVIGIQGFAGVGKSTGLQAFREIAEQRGYQVNGYAPTGKAAQALQQSSGIESNTLDSLLETLNRADSLADHSSSIWVVDETSMANSRQLNQLLNFSRKTNARVLLAGDVAQLSAVEQGKPFEQLQNDGMAVQVMSNIQRQKNPQLKAAVLSAINGNIQQSFNLLESSTSKDTGVITTNNPTTITDHYTALIKQAISEGKTYDDAINHYAKLIIPDNESRREANEQIRQSLQKEGLIEADKIDSTAYINTGLKPEEKADPRSYEKGYVVRFLQDHQATGAAKNSYYRVEKIDSDQQHLHLIDQAGHRIKWHPQTQGGRDQYGVSVYEELDVKLGEGDQLRWRDKNEEAGLKNADTGKVTAINGNKVTLQLKTGREISFNIDDERFKHFEYEYASTVYAAQGDTYQKVIASLESFRVNLVNQKSFYVALSRAVSDVTIYTNDKAGTIKGINTRSGGKTSALEGIGHTYDPDKSDSFVSNATSVPHLGNLEDAARDTIAELSVQEAVFSRNKLIKKIRQNVKGAYSVEVINHVIDQLADNKELRPATLDGEKASIGAFTTNQSIVGEWRNIEYIKQGINQTGAMASHDGLKSVLGSQRFANQNDNTKAAVTFALTNPDRFSALSVSGRQSQIDMSGHLNSAFEQRGFNVKALNISGKQASHIQAETGTPAYSIASFLYGMEKNSQTNLNTDVWLIDQSQMLGTADVGRLLKAAKDTGARVIFIGDSKEIGSISQGKPFQQLLDAGMRHHATNKDSAIPLNQQLNRLFKNTQVEKDKNERLQSAINHYTTLSAEQRQDHLFWIPDAAGRDKANQAIRSTLLSNKELSGKQHTFTTLQRIGMNSKEAANPMQYKPGMTLKSHASHAAIGIEKGGYYPIMAVSPGGVSVTTDNGIVQINNDDLQTLANGGLSAYQDKPLTIANGEKIRIKQSNRDLAVNSGDILNVSITDRKTIQATNHRGETVTLQPHDLAHSHFDYAYTASHFDAAFGQYQSATVIIESHRKNLLSQKTINTLLSHVNGDIHSFTDNQDKARHAITERANNKQSALDAMGFDEQVSRFDKPEPADIQITNLTAEEAVNKAIGHLYNNNAVFKRTDVLKTAITFSGLSHRHINGEIDNQIKVGELVQSSLQQDGIKHQAMITTRAAYRREGYMIDVFKRGLGERKAIGEGHQLDWVSNTMGLNDAQEKAVTHLLFSRDSVTGLEGGLSDKMHQTLKAVAMVANKNDLKVTAFTPRSETTARLEQATGIKAKNVQSLLTSLNNRKHKPNLRNDLWLVNEAGMMNTREMADLLTLARQTGARIILTGDTKQNASVGQGMPFKQLLDNGLKSQALYVNETSRSETTRLAWHDAAAGYAAKALDKLDGNINEIKDPEQRLNQVVGDYLKVPPQKRHQYMLVVPSNNSRDKATKILRDGLKREGTIAQIGITTKTMENTHLTKEQRGVSVFYQPGMYVRFNKPFARLGVTKGEYLQVTASDKDTVTLKSDSGKTLQWNPAKIAGATERGVTVFRERNIEISQGDTIRWKENNRPLGRKTGDIGKISYANDKEIAVTFGDNDKPQILPLADPNMRQFNHAYVETYLSAQGAKSVNYILGVVESYHKRQLNQKSFFTVLNKAKENFHAYVDDKNKVRSQLEKVSGGKLNAMDLAKGNELGQGADQFIGLGHSGRGIGGEREPRRVGFMKVLGDKLFGGRGRDKGLGGPEV